MGFLTFDWVEGSRSHIPAHASQRSTSLHHQSPQRQKALLFGKGKTLPSLHCLQTCRPDGKEEYQIYSHIRDCMLLGEGNKDEGYSKFKFSANWKLNVYRLLKYEAPTFYCEKDINHKELLCSWNACLPQTGDEVLNTTVFFIWILEKKFIHKKDCQVLKQAAQRSVWVTIPGDIYKMCRCST